MYLDLEHERVWEDLSTGYLDESGDRLWRRRVMEKGQRAEGGD
jgi:hypothetical protein